MMQAAADIAGLERANRALQQQADAALARSVAAADLGREDTDAAVAAALATAEPLSLHPRGPAPPCDSLVLLVNTAALAAATPPATVYVGGVPLPPQAASAGAAGAQWSVLGWPQLRVAPESVGHLGTAAVALERVVYMDGGTVFVSSVRRADGGVHVRLLLP
jgi:hypothetical protein